MSVKTPVWNVWRRRNAKVSYTFSSSSHYELSHSAVPISCMVSRSLSISLYLSLSLYLYISLSIYLYLSISLALSLSIYLSLSLSLSLALSLASLVLSVLNGKIIDHVFCAVSEYSLSSIYAHLYCSIKCYSWLRLRGLGALGFVQHGMWTRQPDPNTVSTPVLL